MTEIIIDRANLNKDVGHGKTTVLQTENLSMKPIAEYQDRQKSIADKQLSSPDENANVTDDTTETNAVGTEVGEFDVDALDKTLLEDVPRVPIPSQSYYNQAFEHDTLPAKYCQPSSVSEDAIFTKPSRCSYSGKRKVVAVIVAVTFCILVAIVFFIVGHFFTLGWSPNRAFTSPVTWPPTDALPSVILEASISMQLQQEFLPEYNDASTPQYQALETKFVTYVTEIFLASHLQDIFESVHVTQFRSAGSVVVDFTVILHHNSAGEIKSHLKAITQTEIEYVLNVGILKHGRTDILADRGSIVVIKVSIFDGKTSVTSTAASPGTTAEHYQGVLNSESCGLRPGFVGGLTPLQRIVQGEKSAWSKWPWLVSLHYLGKGIEEPNRHRCGATLISDQWATTAAHCVSNPSSLATHIEDVIVGDLHLEVSSPHRQLIPVERIFIYPGYSAHQHMHDLALIKLAWPVELTDYARPVCLERGQNEILEYSNCYVAGWGTTEYRGNVSDSLLDTKMKLVELDDCIQSYDNLKRVGYSPTEGSICFESARDGGNEGTCNGDSGGPLMCEGDGGRWYMVGVITLGMACNSTVSPVVATRVSMYWDYITAVVDANVNRARCDELISPRCSGVLPYSHIFSSFNQSRLEAVLEFLLSVNGSCGERFEPLICSLMYTGCIGGERSLVPCRDYCMAAVEDCNVTYARTHFIPMVYFAFCDQLPKAWNTDQMICYKDEDARCGNQSTILLPRVGHIRLQSHNYGEPYGNYLDCIHVITAPSGHRVLIKIRHLSLQDADMLEFGEGRDAHNKTTTLAKLRGSQGSPVILSEGEQMWVRFTSTWQVATDVQGYDLELHSLSSDNVSSLCKNDSVGEMHGTPNTWKCDGIVDCPMGVDEEGCWRKLPDVLNAATCGLRPTLTRQDDVRYRIVNGTKVDLGIWPWMVSLRLDNDTGGGHRCGASLISDRWLTTAAHCVWSLRAVLISDVVIGDVHVENESPHHQTVPIERIYTHPGYNHRLHFNDIAVLKLVRPVEITDYARPVCLDIETGVNITEKYTTCYMAGWGRIQHMGQVSEDLLEAETSLVELQDCSDSYAYFNAIGFAITDRVTCVKAVVGANVSSTACNGDSGGPIMCKAPDGRWNMVGIISIGVACSRHPVVVTRVSAYVDYIANLIEGDPHPAKCDRLQSDICSGLLPYDRIFSTSQASFIPVLATMLQNVTCAVTDPTPLLCMLVFQGCTPDGRAILPCREYCERISEQCDAEYFNATGYALSLVGQCSMLPSAGNPDQMTCYMDEDARCGNQTDIYLSIEGSMTLQSPNYPNYYGDRLDCTTLITAPPDHRVLVKVYDLDFLSSYETLAMGSSHDAHDKRTTLAKFHRQDDLRLVISLETELWLRFASMTSFFGDARGYSLEIYAVESRRVQHLCNNESAMFPYSPANGWMCDGIVDCPGGMDEEGCPMTTPGPTTQDFLEHTVSPDVTESTTFPTDVLNAATCGLRPSLTRQDDVRYRIINGTKVDLGIWPWMVRLQLDNDTGGGHWCGASLISDRWLTTAAHCVSSPRAVGMIISDVVIGDVHVENESPHHQTVPIERIYTHPGYNQELHFNDIAVLKLVRPVEINDYARPVCLDVETGVNITEKYTTCYMAGWGSIQHMGQASEDLLEAETSLVELQDCSDIYAHFNAIGFAITDRVTCVKAVVGANVSSTACHGDSGGPIMCKAPDGRWNMVGIISIGVACSRHPVVVTRVSAYVDYIANIIEGDPHPAKCERLQSDICSGLLPYDRIFSTSQASFIPVLATMLQNVTCAVTDPTPLLCMLVFHGCTPDGRAILPCREYCERISEQCDAEYFNATGYALSRIGKCSLLPSAGSPDQMTCYRDEDARCGNQTDIYLSIEGSMTLQSPNYPNYYGDRLDCTRLITAPPDHRVLVKVYDLDFLTSYETLALGSSHDAQDKRTTLAKFHRQDDLRLVISLETELWLRFASTTSFLGDARGYSLEIYAVESRIVQHLCNNELVQFPYSPPDSWMCDGIVDCPGGMDEEGCLTTTPAPTTHVILNQPGCGVQWAGLSPRIVGGSVTEHGHWPWLGSLRYRQYDGSSNHGCAASLIAPQWVITAAHCVDSPMYRRGKITVVFGDSNLNETTDDHVEIAVESIHSHPGFNYVTTEHDIAVLKLAHPVTFTDHVLPVCLDKDEVDIHNSSVCYIAGWGLTNATEDELPFNQQELEVHRISQSTCTEAISELGLFGIMTENMICAEGLDGQSPCNGDSGGALVCRNDQGIWFEVGIISAVFGCSTHMYPALYTKISPYIDFITSTINGDSHASCEALEPANNCSSLVPYTNTFSTTQPFYQDLIHQFHGFEECHHRAEEFMCLMLMPGCEPTVLPCRGFCQEIVDNCSATYNARFGLPLWFIVDCDVYPVGPSNETMACIKGEDARCKKSDDDGEIHIGEVPVTLLSPRYPSYDAFLQCTWLVTGPPTSSGILIKFLALDYAIEKQNALVIGYSHSSQNLSTQLERYTGLQKTGPLLIKSRKAWIWFATGGAPAANNSDNGRQPGGFKLEIHATNITDVNTLCTAHQDGPQDNLIVMPAWWYCDGFPDCPSGVDEMDCPSAWHNRSYFLNSTTCGRRSRVSSVSSYRVVGGEPAVEGSWPWMVSLRHVTNKHECGATLISESWAISAAHCLGCIDNVVLGDLRMDSPSPFHVNVKIKEVYTHKELNYTTGRLDLILIRLAHPVQLNDHVNIACLPDPELTLAANTTGTILGWGDLVEGSGNLSATLQEVEIPILSDAVCSELSPSPELGIDDQLLCAGYREGQVDTCQGDSGGPLLYQDVQGRWTVVGLTSFGVGCARPNHPGYYTKVSTAMDFILAVLAGETHPMAVRSEMYP